MMLNTTEAYLQNNFTIVSKLAEGSYASVFKVIRKQDNVEYAMKKINLNLLSEKEKISAFGEIQILASIRDPNVVLFKECFLDSIKGYLYIIMEYADDGDLSLKLKKLKDNSSRTNEKIIWAIFIQILKGLNSLHALKVYHRDIKADNVFLWSDGRAKIGDLNVSKLAIQGFASSQAGAPLYASPEVWARKPYDYKADIWSLGCLLYEMCSGEAPFYALDLPSLYQAIIEGKHKSIPACYSKELEIIIDFCLQQDPKLRPSCSELLNHEIIQKKMMLMPKNILSMLNFASESTSLIQTIPYTENLSELSNYLPKPNYIPLKLISVNELDTLSNAFDNKNFKENNEVFNFPEIIDVAFKIPNSLSFVRNFLKKNFKQQESSSNQLLEESITELKRNAYSKRELKNSSLPNDKNLHESSIKLQCGTLPINSYQQNYFLKGSKQITYNSFQKNLKLAPLKYLTISPNIYHFFSKYVILSNQNGTKPHLTTLKQTITNTY